MTERPPLDEIDLKILSELQRDGRIRNNELAERVGLSEPPCRRRVRSLRERGHAARQHEHAAHRGERKAASTAHWQVTSPHAPSISRRLPSWSRSCSSRQQ